MHGKRSFAVLAAMIVALLASSGAAAAEFSPGADGLGDPMFPQAGNGGYDVQHYALTLDYTPSGNQLVRHRRDHGARDPEPVEVRSRLPVGAAGDHAGARQRRRRVIRARRCPGAVITPAAGLVQGETFTVTVATRGRRSS